jgi:DNA topoisomerase-1
VSHDGVNATLSSDMTPETITLEQAVGLLDARTAGGGGKKPPAKARSTARKAPAKPKAAAKAKPPVSADAKPARKKTRGQ